MDLSVVLDWYILRLKQHEREVEAYRALSGDSEDD